MPEAAISKHFISCAAVFIVADIHRAVAFYRDQLGFEISDICDRRLRPRIDHVEARN